MLNGLAEAPPPLQTCERQKHVCSSQRLCAVTVDHNNLSYHNTVFRVGRHTVQLIKNALFSRRRSLPHLRAAAYTGQVMS